MKNEFLNEIFEGKVINFEILKEFIKRNLGKKQNESNLKKQNIKKRLEKNQLISEIFGGILTCMFFIPIIVGLLGILYSVGFFGVKSFELFKESYLLANREFVDEMKVLGYSILGLGSASIGGVILLGSYFVISEYAKPTMNFIENICKKIDVIQEKLLSKLSKRSVKEYEVENQNLQRIQTILENLDKADDCYKYMIHSSLMYKTFTESEVGRLFKLLMEGYDINSLIFLLYYDRLQEFEMMTADAKKMMIRELDIDKTIAKVREYNTYLEQLRQKEFEQTGVKQRKRRTTKLYDEMIEEHSAQLETIINNSSGKRHR